MLLASLLFCGRFFCGLYVGQFFAADVVTIVFVTEDLTSPTLGDLLDHKWRLTLGAILTNGLIPNYKVTVRVILSLIHI